MTKTEAFDEINRTQDDYIDQLIQYINDQSNQMKVINFTSPTGTGKTKMMAKLINKLPDCFFIITTLSKGQLHLQIKKSLENDCLFKNYKVYGSMDYKVNSRLSNKDIIDIIPNNTKCIWLRDEGHIKTNRYDELLEKYCYRIINFSATNTYSDIKCNFTHTMMLRTVNQQTGTPEDAINKLIQIKQNHKNVKNYNPCAIFRCISGDKKIYEQIIDLCKKRKLKYIDISTDQYNMDSLCEDNNEYDVIINKFKIVEGIDLRRAHVLYMDNQPNNDATTIQAIGRCRRNALLYRTDIDILSQNNSELLKNTRECFVYYNVKTMKINTDTDGELCYAFCPYISCESLKKGAIVSVVNGQLQNGLFITELEGQNGKFTIKEDATTGFNIVDPITDFYKEKIEKPLNYLYVHRINDENEIVYKKIHIDDVLKLPTHDNENEQYYSFRKDIDIAKNSKLNIKIPLKERKEILNNILLKQQLVDKAAKACTVPVFLSTINISDSDKNIKDYIDKYIHEFKKVEKYVKLFDREMTLSKINDRYSKKVQEYFQYYCIREYITKRNLPFYTNQPEELYVNIIHKSEKAVNAISNLNMDNTDTSNLLKIISCSFNGFIPDIYKNIDELSKRVQFPKMKSHMIFGRQARLKKIDIKKYFSEIAQFLNNPNLIYTSNIDELKEWMANGLNTTYNNILNNIVDEMKIDFSHLYKPVTKEEYEQIESGKINISYQVDKRRFIQNRLYSHGTIVNDHESAIIGVDNYKPIRSNNGETIWIESASVTSKIKNFNKLNKFITQKYAKELEAAKPQLFSGKNSFELDNRCNSMLGFCVEYYSKYILYGKDYLEKYIQRALNEYKKGEITDDIVDENSTAIIIRACMIKYKEMMQRSFGNEVKKVIRTVTVSSLIQEKYQYFIDLVICLGTQTANFVKETLYVKREPADNVDPNLSVEHISGIADYITKDTILDVKVTNHIDETYVKQVLAYHYLSTKRDDLKIKKVIIYDATSNKSITIQITRNNISKNKILF